MHLSRFLLILTLSGTIFLHPLSLSAQDRLYATEVDQVDVRLFIPDQTSQLRGLLVHVANYKFSHGNRWTELARELQFGQLVLSMDMKRTNRPSILTNAIKEALDVFAEQSQHPELPFLPLVATGHSAGGMGLNVVSNTPERMLTAAIDCSWIANHEKLDASLRQTPLLFTIGAISDDFKMLPAIEAHLNPAREAGWLYGFGLEWGKAHNFANAGTLSAQWIKSVAALRLPAEMPEPGAPIPLRAMQEKDGWLGDRGTWDTGWATIAPYANYQGDRAAAVWLPDRATAWIWRAYQAKDAPWQITAASSDGKATLGEFRPKREFQVEMEHGQDVLLGISPLREAGKLKLVSFYQGDQLLHEAAGEPWTHVWKNPAAGAHALFIQYETEDGVVGVTNPALIIVRAAAELKDMWKLPPALR